MLGTLRTTRADRLRLDIEEMRTAAEIFRSLPSYAAPTDFASRLHACAATTRTILSSRSTEEIDDPHAVSSPGLAHDGRRLRYSNALTGSTARNASSRPFSVESQNTPAITRPSSEMDESTSVAVSGRSTP